VTEETTDWLYGSSSENDKKTDPTKSNENLCRIEAIAVMCRNENST